MKRVTRVIDRIPTPPVNSGEWEFLAPEKKRTTYDGVLDEIIRCTKRIEEVGGLPPTRKEIEVRLNMTETLLLKTLATLIRDGSIFRIRIGGNNYYQATKKCLEGSRYGGQRQTS